MRSAFSASPRRLPAGFAGSRNLYIENLEDRRLLATLTLTANEQLLVELINRARQDPLAEVARTDGIADLNEGLSSGSINSDAKQPLALHQALINASGEHSDDMLNRDFFNHVNPNGDSPSDRAQAAGYPGGAGENIAWGGSTGTIDEIDHVYQRHEALFLSPGHRLNIMNDDYQELGVGVRYGIFTSSRDWNASMVTEMFSYRFDNPYLTGVVYTDTVKEDDFYTVGEGVGNIVVTAVDDNTGVTFVETTGVSGGYSLQLPAGTYTVTATGDGIDGEFRATEVIIGQENVKLDVITTDVVAPIEINGASLVGLADGQLYRADSTGDDFVISTWDAWPDQEGWEDVQLADLDGDGAHEIVGRRSNGEWWVTRAAGDGSYVTEQWGIWSSAIGWVDVQVADINGDKLDDIVGRTTTGRWWAAISNGDNFTNEYWGLWSRSQVWQDVLVGDFNGDGRDDIAGRVNDGSWWIASSTGDAFENEKWGRWSTRVTWTNVNVGDFDNDGRDDLLGRANSSWWMARSNGTAFTNEKWGVWTTNIDWQDISVGDFDNDGRDDIIGRDGGAWWVGRSDGQAFQSSRWSQWSNAVTWSGVRIADFNNDGRDDIVAQTNNRLWVGTSTGDGFDTTAWGIWPNEAFDAYFADLVS